MSSVLNGDFLDLRLHARFRLLMSSINMNRCISALDLTATEVANHASLAWTLLNWSNHEFIKGSSLKRLIHSEGRNDHEIKAMELLKERLIDKIHIGLYIYKYSLKTFSGRRLFHCRCHTKLFT